MLNEYEQKKYDIILKIVSKEITVKEAMAILNLTERQIYRLKNIYVENGKEGFIHKSRGKVSLNKKDDKLIEKLETLYLEEYHDFNFEHFYEDVVFGNYDVSYAVMLKYFTNDDIISLLAHKETVKLYNEKIKNTIKDNGNYIKAKKIELYKSRMIEVEKAHIRRANNLFVFGQEVQMDAQDKIIDYTFEKK